jgi:hypothetical protein
LAQSFYLIKFSEYISKINILKEECDARFSGILAEESNISLLISSLSVSEEKRDALDTNIQMEVN